MRFLGEKSELVVKLAIVQQARFVNKEIRKMP
jgi:hypothetical protein